MPLPGEPIMMSPKPSALKSPAEATDEPGIGARGQSIEDRPVDPADRRAERTERDEEQVVDVAGGQGGEIGRPVDQVGRAARTPSRGRR